MKITDASETDFERIIELNSSEVSKTSDMDIDKLIDLDCLSIYHKVILLDGQVEGFMLVILAGKNYANESYNWFSSKYESFHYIDRVVINSSCAGKGLGSALYNDFFTFSETHVRTMTCEYNLEPLNRVSKALHLKYGFSEVGRLMVGNQKLVSLQTRTI